MAYRVLCDGVPIYDLRSDDLVLTSPIVHLKDNDAGSFTFGITPKHPHYNDIKPLKSVIQVFHNDDEIFCGRMTESNGDFYNQKEKYCEGELNILVDSIQRPAEYHDMTVRGFLQTLIDIHNAQVFEGNIAIKFNANCKGESKTWDYVYIYYQHNGKIYRSEKFSATDLANKTIILPTLDFWLWWHTDSSVNSYYGFSIDSVDVTMQPVTITATEVTSIPTYTVTETKNIEDVQTPHNPYKNNANLLWHFTKEVPEDYVSAKEFRVGVVTVTDSNDSLYRYTNYETTLTCINEKLVKKLGGHIRIRKVNGIRYIDYLADYPETSDQIIEFGKNLLDYSDNTTTGDIATAIIPLGAKLEESTIEALEERLTIASVNNGCDFVYNQKAVDLYGWIFKTVTFDNVHVAENLLKKGQEYLNEVQYENMTLDVSAVDLHDLDVDIDKINILNYVRVKSEPHGLDQLFPVTEMDIALDAPETNRLRLGEDKVKTMTNTSKSTNAEIMEKVQNIPSKSDILKEAQENASELIQTATHGHVVTTANEQLIMDTDDISTAKKLWRWNLNGLGYSSTGYNGKYNLAITMDGQIVGERIVAGSITAEKLDAGYKTSVETAIELAESNANAATDEKLKTYYTKSEVETRITTTKDAVLLSAKQTSQTYTDNRLKNYSTSAQIKVTTDAITSQVNKKLNTSDFSSTLQQNWYGVKVAWNNITEYVQIEYGEFNIYNWSSDLDDYYLMMSLHSTGQSFYTETGLIGTLGTSWWTELPEYRGLVFDLEEDAGWMSWSVWNPDYNFYETKLAYHNSDETGNAMGIHFYAPTYTHGWLYLNDYEDRLTYFDDDSVGVLLENDFYFVEQGSRKNTSIAAIGPYYGFTIFNNVSIDFYSDLDMHYYDILHESDSRLKTNIVDTQVNALDVLDKIELKSFDWIESGKHIDVGMIAQQLEMVLPQMVKTNEETDVKSIRFLELIPYLIKAIQELKSIVSPPIALMSLDGDDTESETTWVDDMEYVDKKAFTINHSLNVEDKYEPEKVSPKTYRFPNKRKV